MRSDKLKNLVIVESPSKSKTIEKYLGKDYKVLSSKGHIRDLATKGKYGLGVDSEGVKVNSAISSPTYTVDENGRRYISSFMIRNSSFDANGSIGNTLYDVSNKTLYETGKYELDGKYRA